MQKKEEYIREEGEEMIRNEMRRVGNDKRKPREERRRR
jgi:hypothetical protein